MQTTTKETRFGAKLAELGITMESSAGVGGVDASTEKDGRGWPHIAYAVTLARNGKVFWAGPYKLGTGHVKWPTEEQLERMQYRRMSGRDDAIHAARLRVSRPNARLLPEDEARAAAGLAWVQGVKPTLESVMSSLLLDGACHFDGETFSDWCANCGYSDDSIRAKRLFEACEEIGKSVRRALSHDAIQDLRNIASEEGL